MTSKDLAINDSFFNQLWPLILDENICDIRSKNTSEFFIPEQPFDALWAHGFLASKNYEEYEPPLHFPIGPCCPEENEENSSDLKRTSVSLDTEETEPQCEFAKGNKILPIDQQIKQMACEAAYREKLADDFMNRTYPWYMEEPSVTEFEFTNEIIELFKRPMEREVLRDIHVFDCRLLIVNVGPEICWLQIEAWVKFCKYLKVLILVRSECLAVELSHLNESILTLNFQDNNENTWQQELTRALDDAVSFAVNMKILGDCIAPFVYVFPSRSDIDSLDRFRILRKS